jgi:hypothetical protein
MVADGLITIEGLAAERLNRKLKVGKMLNKQSGKESSKQSAFGEANWGSATRKYLCWSAWSCETDQGSRYLKSVNNLLPGSLAKIIEKTKPFVKASNRSAGVNESDGDGDGDGGDDDDERANLVDVPDDDDNALMMCMLNSLLIFAVLTH